MYVYHLSTFTNVALTVGLNSNGFTSQIHLVQIPPLISHSLSLSLARSIPFNHSKIQQWLPHLS